MMNNEINNSIKHKYTESINYPAIVYDATNKRIPHTLFI